MIRHDLAELSAFATVAEERSFTRAAARLGISQSALSHSMRGLERRLARISRAPWNGAGQQWVQVPPGNWIAPPGSNRRSGGGDEAA